MRPRLYHVLLWVGIYLFLAIAPLAAVLLPPLPAGRSFWVEFSVGLGFVGLSMLALQFVLTARFHGVAEPFGLDTILQFHRQAGLVAATLVLAHPVILFIYAPAYLEYLDPRVSVVRALALWALTGALVLVIILTLWREKLRLPYEWWRLSHGVLGSLVVFIGLAHVLRVGHYMAAPWKQALWIAFTAGAILLLVHVRLIKPRQALRRPYQVAAVSAERGKTWTVTLVPVGHAGMKFRAGQFAWLTLGPSPYSLEQHPFSFSSSAAKPARLEFAIKELGDYTRNIGSVAVGSSAYLDGPYGALTLDPDNSGGAAFVGGGIGISPIMSMLRTLKDLHDRRPHTLIYGSRAWDDVIFREELDELQKQLDLKVVHVLRKPPPDWQGESGQITGAMLDRYFVDPIGSDTDFFICGAPPMMDLVESHLVARGVPLRNIHSERFDIA